MIVVLITASSQKEANLISEKLIKLKLCACVNIIKGISSIYHWKGKVEKSKEVLLIIKTKKKSLNKLIKKVKELHSYSVPEIIALPILDGNKEYLNWIESVVG